ncbi:MAG: IS630 family transposase [Alphaproteobacteria bacterium]|nr:IS630 family transposase [Alphaproteobacteria bacterium]
MKSWLIPKAGPDFVCAMEEVLDVYERPYNPKNPHVCLDESPCQLIGEARKSFTDSQGTEHIDYEYKRNGTVDLYMIVEPLGGRREVHVRDTHTRLDWAEMIAYIVEEMYPDAEKITLVQDNLAAHKKSALYELFEPERARNILKKIEFIFTPKHGSWLNIAESELSVLLRQQLSQRIESKDDMIKLVTEWYEVRNEEQSVVDWQFKTKDARIKLKRLYPSYKS